MPTFLDAVATALLTYATHSLVACAIALVAARFLRRPHDRELVWKTALIAPVLTTAMMMILSSTGAGPAFVDLATVARRFADFRLPARLVLIRVHETPAGRDVFRQVIDPVTDVLTMLAIAVAACCVALAFIRFVRRRRALSRALAPRQIVSGWTDAAQGRTVELSIAESLQSPVAFGTASICLPANVLSDFLPEHRDALIAHELAHLERRDPAWLFAAEAIAALSAFQPLIWIVTRAFRRDVELICDEAALRRTSDRRALIGALALLAAPFDPRSPLSGAATAYDGSPLVARAQRIASVPLERRGSRTPGIALATVACLVAMLFAIPVVSSAARLSDIPLNPLDSVNRLRAEGRVVTVDSTIAMHQRRMMVLVRSTWPTPSVASSLVTRRR